MAVQPTRRAMPSARIHRSAHTLSRPCPFQPHPLCCRCFVGSCGGPRVRDSARSAVHLHTTEPRLSSVVSPGGYRLAPTGPSPATPTLQRMHYGTEQHSTVIV
ncbi:hypothetical protein Mapa_010886 [Marchantia paleacea]|nr:hypothetical protein Mapa_010886 [Marchantia paleacea]